jgi:hypothetical protein
MTKLPYTRTFEAKGNGYRYSRVIGGKRRRLNEGAEVEATYRAACAEVVPVKIKHPMPGFDLANYARQRARHRVRKANATLRKLSNPTTRFDNEAKKA